MEFSEQLKIYAETHFENRKKYFAPILSEIEAGLSLCSEEEALLIKFFLRDDAAAGCRGISV